MPFAGAVELVRPDAYIEAVSEDRCVRQQDICCRTLLFRGSCQVDTASVTLTGMPGLSSAAGSSDFSLGWLWRRRKPEGRNRSKYRSAKTVQKQDSGSPQPTCWRVRNGVYYRRTVCVLMCRFNLALVARHSSYGPRVCTRDSSCRVRKLANVAMRFSFGDKPGSDLLAQSGSQWHNRTIM
jgi:hypothetical protein